MKVETDIIADIAVSPIEKFENTKGLIEICKWKDRHNGQKEKD